ncbi:MAG: class I SAM-dependent methyltransferase [Candidatus Eisenbacteria bacterium]
MPQNPHQSPSAEGRTGRFDSADGFALYEGNQDLERRNRALLDLLPADAHTWLDVGCGPGVAARALAASGRTVVSLDLSRAALAGGPPRPVLASSGALPFRGRCFDGVLCLEVLEHLPPELFERTIAELARVARRKLLIGVPHAENLARNLILCPRCGATFNRSGHLRSFQREDLIALFPGFKPEAEWIGGPEVRDYPAWLLSIRHRVARRFSEMSGWAGNVCPECGLDRFPAFRHNLLSFALDGLNRLSSRRRPYWLVVLFSKESIDD